MSIVSILSDSACKWLQVKLEALVVGDCLPDSRRPDLEDHDGNCYGSWESVRVVNRKETDCHRTKVPELQMQNAVLFCRAEHGKGQ
jgi:hypothetical protein